MLFFASVLPSEDISGLELHSSQVPGDPGQTAACSDPFRALFFWVKVSTLAQTGDRQGQTWWWHPDSMCPPEGAAAQRPLSVLSLCHWGACLPTIHVDTYSGSPWEGVCLSDRCLVTLQWIPRKGVPFPRGQFWEARFTVRFFIELWAL